MPFRIIRIQRKLGVLKGKRLWNIKTKYNVLLTGISNNELLGLHDLMRGFLPLVREV